MNKGSDLKDSSDIIRGYLLLLLLFLGGCNSHETTIAGKGLITDSITINNVNVKMGIKMYSDTEPFIINYLSPNKQKAYRYNGLTQTITDSITILSGASSVNFYIDTAGNYFCLKTTPKHVYKYSKDGSEQRIYFKEEAKTILSSLSIPFRICGNTLLLYRLPQYFTKLHSERVLFYNTDFLGLYRLYNDSAKRKSTFGNFPDIYKKKYTYELYPVANHAGKDTTVYIFSNDNILYLYDHLSKALTTHTIRGLRKNHAADFDTDQILNLSYIKRYLLKEDRYQKILPDLKSKHYLVFHTYGIPEKDKNGMLNLPKDKPLVLNVIDSSFCVTKKISFDNTDEIHWGSSYFHDGYLYMKAATHDKSSVKLYVYKIL